MFTLLQLPTIYLADLAVYPTYFFLTVNAQPPHSQAPVEHGQGHAGHYGGYHTTAYPVGHSESHPVTHEDNHEFYDQQHKKLGLVKNIRRLLKYLLWGFTLFLLAYYFANLTAHLIHRQAQRNQIRNVNDLVGQSRVQYGFVRNGPVHQYLLNSVDPVHQQLLRNVQAQSPSGFVSNYSEGCKEFVIAMEILPFY
uniref:Ionotropic glutamate receptor C-terminal domain-containing protein n=1 Tax=Ditylenchus dipsaci TaxID=166011 RepID=A0A915CNE4_9BILA